MKFGALKVANNLDRFGHTSVFSNVENASATKAIRKPLINQNGPASALPLLLFLVTGAEVGVGVLGPAPAAGLLGTADMALHAAAASDGVFLY